jgi:signal peptidase
MKLDRLLGTAVTVLLVVLVVSMVAGQVLGQPVLLGYVTSGSMEPTISEGDGYLVVPTFVTGSPQEGDIVVFEAREVQGGGLTAHRIVGERSGGYVTKGDANPFTDQSGGEPPVTEGQIAGVVVQIDGDPVTVPHLGTAAEGLRGLVAAPISLLGVGNAGPVLMFVGIGLLLLAGFSGGGRTTSRDRDRRNVVAVRLLAAVAVVVVTGAATVGMVMPSGVYEFGVVATDNPGEAPEQVEPGGATEFTYETTNGGLLPTLIITEPASDGVATSPDRTVLGGSQKTEVTVTATAPDEEGTYVRSIRETRYLLVLPPGVIAALHSVNPLLALAAVDLVVALFVLAVFFAAFGRGLVRFRSGPNHVPARTRLRRRFRRRLRRRFGR